MSDNKPTPMIGAAGTPVFGRSVMVIVSGAVAADFVSVVPVA